MSDEIEVLRIVTQRLEGAGIAYMVSGSMALNYYAQPRMTRDIDFVVEVASPRADEFVALFSADFVCEAEAVRDALRQHGVFNIIHAQWIVKADFIVRKDLPYRREEFRRRRRIALDGLEIWMVAAEDLLLSKLHWAKDSRSEQQMRDARNLIASVPNLDWPYIEQWAQELAVTDLLAEARS